jgi:hypothetical protein
MTAPQRDAHLERLAESAGEDARDFVDDDRADWLAGDAERETHRRWGE